MAKPYIQNVPVEYMDVQTLWNDRRDPHANPLSTNPRRMYDRAPSPSGLGSMVEQVYRPSPKRDFDEGKTSKLSDERLPFKGKVSD
jgi:hypothetical protein